MRRGVVLLVCALGWACAAPEERESTFQLPRPALEEVDPRVRDQLEERSRAVATMLASPEATPVERAGALGELGRLYHAYDLTTDAEACYREAVRLVPASGWHYYLGFLDQVRGELEVAADSYRRALEVEPADLAARLRLADVLTELGRAEAAATLYAEALELDPGSAAAHRGLARLAADAGRHREAVDRYRRALESQPGATSLHYPLSLSLRSLGDLDGAAREAERAGNGQVTFADPRVASLDELALGAGVRLARGGVALAEGRVEQALEEYRRAVAAAPDNPAARTNLALVLAGRGDTEEAIEQLVEALRLEPSNLGARLALADLQAAGGEMERAIDSFDAVLAARPDHFGALRGRAAVHLARGDSAAAAADFERVVELAPQDAGARLQLGSLLQQAGDPAGAERHYRAALELDLPAPEAAAVHLSLGNLAAERRTFEAALSHYDSALELAPGLAPAIYNRAGTLAELGRLGEAAAGYSSFLEIEPQSAAARFYLGDALLRSGDPGAAVAAFRRVAAGDPHYERARLGIAVGLKRAGRRAEALASLEGSVAELPRSALLAHELALTLASSAQRELRDGERAVELAGRLFTAQPSPMHAETLAMALAEAGRFEAAVEIQSRLLSETAAGDPARVARLRQVLELYRRGEACCPPPPS